MDLTASIAPRSDQLNAEDLLTGPRMFTIEKVTEGNHEQPVNVHLVEYPGRPYKPSKSMLRVMVAAWESDANVYAGRRLVLYRDPDITFGKDKVGGIRIAAMSHIEEPLTLWLTVTRGKRKPFTVKPLPADAPTPEPIDYAAQIENTAGDVDALRRLWADAKSAGADETTLNLIAQAAKEATT